MAQPRTGEQVVRGADIVMRNLEQAGIRTIFALSGNHIMSLFDAALGTSIKIVHVRHEAAAVHMADAWGRLTGKPGVALVTGGPGHANAVGALFTAQAAESPVVLLSGHVAAGEVGHGGFQELRQADMAAPVTKRSWTAASAETLGEDVASALRIATSGRPGPVHLSLPVDLIEDSVPESAITSPQPGDFTGLKSGLPDMVVNAVIATITSAERPIILGGPTLCSSYGRALLAHLETAFGAPAVGMEGPRGLSDATLGAFAECLPKADLLVLLGKPHDYAIRFGRPPLINPECRFVLIDPDPPMLERAAKAHGSRVVVSVAADSITAAETLLARAPHLPNREDVWLQSVRETIRFRPPEWEQVSSPPDGPLHPLDICRAIEPLIANSQNSILICEGGEIGQWPQAQLRPARRIINGVAGSIGAAIPFAIGARAVDPEAVVIVVMGDGAFGFHMSEFETAVRCNLPFVVVLGNDARWNAEHQIQLREYGADRAIGCELLSARYDQVVEALGGYGESVSRPDQLASALERAVASGRPACLNVALQSVPAPVIRRG